MPERVLVYDTYELEWQIIGKEQTEESRRQKLDYREKKSRMKKGDYLFPVVTIVMYLGIDHWEGRRKLSELYRIPGEIWNAIKESFPEYGFLLAEADFVNPESFKTDLREFFQVMQCRKDKKRLKELLNQENFQKLDKETAWTIAVYLDRKRLVKKIEKEGLDVCPALKEWAEDERREGKLEERISIIRNMIREGMDYEVIYRITGCSQKELASIAEG